MNKMMNTDDMVSMISLLPNAETEEAETFFYDYLQNNLANYQQLPSFLNNIKKIDDYSFARRNISITSLPNGVVEIGGGAFEQCNNLTSLSLPDSLTTIRGSAFSGCFYLNITTLPSSISRIESMAFFDCNKLTSITFKGTPTNIGQYAFRECSNLVTINVPWAEGEVANAPWGAANATINYNYTEA